MFYDTRILPIELWCIIHEYREEAWKNRLAEQKFLKKIRHRHNRKLRCLKSYKRPGLFFKECYPTQYKTASLPRRGSYILTFGMANSTHYSHRLVKG